MTASRKKRDAALLAQFSPAIRGFIADHESAAVELAQLMFLRGEAPPPPGFFPVGALDLFLTLTENVTPRPTQQLAQCVVERMTVIYLAELRELATTPRSSTSKIESER